MRIGNKELCLFNGGGWHSKPCRFPIHIDLKRFENREFVAMVHIRWPSPALIPSYLKYHRWIMLYWLKEEDEETD